MTANSTPTDTPDKRITTEPTKTALGVRDALTPYVAVAALGFLALLFYYLMRHIDMPQQAWDRMMYLLNGVEAIGFAAAGYLFGKEVNRQRAEKAEQTADKAELAAERSAQDASNGRSLAMMVKAKATRSSALEGGRTQSRASSEELQELAAVADQMFPRL